MGSPGGAPRSPRTNIAYLFLLTAETSKLMKLQIIIIIIILLIHIPKRVGVSRSQIYDTCACFPQVQLPGGLSSVWKLQQ